MYLAAGGANPAPPSPYDPGEAAAAARRAARAREDVEFRIKWKKEGRQADLHCLEREREDGNVEYKLRLKDPNPSRLQQLVRWT